MLTKVSCCYSSLIWTEVILEGCVRESATRLERFKSLYMLLHDQVLNPNCLRVSAGRQALGGSLITIRCIPTRQSLQINLEVGWSGRASRPRCELGLDLQTSSYLDHVGSEMVFCLHWLQNCPHVRSESVGTWRGVSHSQQRHAHRPTMEPTQS